MYITAHQLDTQQLKDLKKLQTSCIKKDSNSSNLYTHILAQPRTLPSALLYYKQERLLGFLSVFFFYENAVEISLMIAPKERRKGLAKKLLGLILPLIQNYNFSTLIFSSPAGLNDRWLTREAFTYTHTEYHMKRNRLSPLLHYEASPFIRLMQESDVLALIHLDEVCFSKKQIEAQERFNYLLQDSSYQIFVLLQNNMPIAKAHLRWQPDGVTLSDIAVLPSLQGQGIGSSLIAHCINLALIEGKPTIRLDVETKNERALNLYTRLGFVKANACDYWKITLDELRSKL
ncbi:MAG: GNAT family N-acetyltransferase [Legionella sp.]|nr:GNAT family N-acetyltransferase [Legionella sp.]